MPLLKFGHMGERAIIKNSRKSYYALTRVII